MILEISFIVGGIILVLGGADRLTEGAVAVAERMNVPQIVIGLTVVALGTSMPEFCVSLISALKGTPDLAVGNIVGSNIFNSLLIVGAAAMVMPMTILKSTVRKDIPFALVASTVLLMMCLDGNIGRLDAAILFALFIAFMYFTLKQARSPETAEEPQPKKRALWLSVVWIVVGLACLIGGSNLFVDGATAVATQLGVSEAVIGLTIVAGGTSLPNWLRVLCRPARETAESPSAMFLVRTCSTSSESSVLRGSSVRWSCMALRWPTFPLWLFR